MNTDIINTNAINKNLYRGLQKIPGVNTVQYLKLNNNLFVVNPKVGSSSVIFSMVKDYKKNHHVSVKDFYAHVSFSSKFKLRKISKKTSFNFAITRDPFSRLYSCYKQKVLLDDGPRLTKNYFFQYYPLIKNKQNFNDFVRAVCLIPDSLSEKHFMSQSRILGYPKNSFNINRIYEISELSKLEDDLRDEYSSTFNLERHNTTSKKSLDLSEIYDKKHLTMVHDRYYDDIVNFGYEKLYLELMDSI